MKEYKKLADEYGEISEALKSYDKIPVKKGEASYNHLVGICRKAELATVKLRELPQVDLHTDTRYYIGNYGGNFNTRITFESVDHEIEKITLPRLLPKRDHQSRRYLQSCYYNAIREHYRGRKKPQEEMVLWYVHCYPIGKRTLIIDYTNYETKAMTDMLTPFLLTDDSPRYIQYHASLREVYEKDFRTEIYLLPSRLFADFFTTVLEESKGEYREEDVL